MESTLQFLNDTINTYKLDKHNAQGYYILRDEYNTTKAPLLLLALIAFSFNHQVRFNNTHNFNTPFGKNRSSFNSKMRANLIAFIQALQSKDITFLSLDFKEALDSLSLDSQSFVYADPPYLITQGTYNDGKRGFSGWSESLELQLLQSLDRLDSKGMYFALSNVLVHKGRENTILKKWIQSREYTIHNIDSHYTNANYQTKYKDKSLTQEVLITNYKAL